MPGPDGCYYLSQTPAGQCANSPCVDAGNDTAVNLDLDMLTTRTDEITDTGIVDIGFHYPVTNRPLAMGDFDCDGRISLRDFAGFQNCFTGSGGSAADVSPGCRVFDFKADAEVNFGDYIAFKSVLEGP